jgi:DNA-binding CsgD family transcriptional regulator
MHENEEYFFEALASGASGYVLKTAVDRDLVEACRAAMRGEPFLYPGAVRALIREHLERARAGGPSQADPLTPREQEIVKLIAEAHTNEQIAELLFISKKTVERHRANVLEKLGMRDRVELTRYAIRRGLVQPEARSPPGRKWARHPIATQAPGRHHRGMLRVALLGDRPADQFANHALDVRLPFATPHARRQSVTTLAAAGGARLHRGRVSSIDVEEHQVVTDSGEIVAYDVVLLAIGAVQRASLPHAPCFGSDGSQEHMHGLVQDVEAGYVRSIAFVMPAAARRAGRPRRSRGASWRSVSTARRPGGAHDRDDR